jgi:hypothetical protein
MNKVTESLENIHIELCKFGVRIPHLIEITFRSEEDLKTIVDILQNEINFIIDNDTTLKLELPGEPDGKLHYYQISGLETVLKCREDGEG